MQRKSLVRMIALALLLALIVPSAQAASYQTLAFGSRGTSVRKLQTALLALGYDPGGTDGKFGTGTQTAVIQYQTGKGLTADGKAGALTQKALYADVATATQNSASGSASSGSTETTTSSGTLKYGDRGTAVTKLQTALVKLGFNTNGVDGSYGNGTLRAVKQFQRDNGLYADGLAGSKTQTLLYKLAENGASTESSGSSSSAEGSDSSTTGFTRTLRRGYTGADVRSAQTRLKELGYYTGSIDGSYGAGTMSAVTTFQRRNGLDADGLLGRLSYSKLYSSSAIAATSGATADDGDKDESTTDSSTTDSSDSTGDSAETYTTLSLGSSGTAVKTLQKALKALGYNVTTDGEYGALTKQAVTYFQKLNGLTADGVAGAKTQEKVFSDKAVKFDKSVEDTGVQIDEDTGKASGPKVSKVKCLYWYTEVKPNMSAGQTITIFDPATSLQWSLRLYSLGHHADSEPLTATDTAIQYKAFGNVNTWTPKPVYVKLPSGTWTLASMHNVPHLTGSIKDNDFDGHLCVHFLRTMEECSANDPNYGVQHQNAIRKKWKQMTGNDIAD